jgi:diguanylate cyclase (GGDEF)-like protein
MTPATIAPTNLSKRSNNTFLWLLFGGVVYYVFAKLGMAIFSLHPSNITLLWLPAGIGMVMCRTVGQRALPFIFVASFIANLSGLATDSILKQLIHTAISAGADTLAAGMSAQLMRRYLPDGLTRFSQLFRFILTVCVLPTLICALILAANLVVGGYIPAHSSLSFIAMLLFADSLGILLIYPLFESWRSKTTLSGFAWRTWIVATLLVLGSAYLAFHFISGLIFLIFPILLLLAFYNDSREVYLSLLLSLCFIIALASAQLGPFNLASIEQSYFMLLTFLFTTAIVTLGMRLQHNDFINEHMLGRNWMFLANHDALTGLANRLLFIPMIEKEIARAQRKQHSFTVAIIDIDNFKAINDSYGHLVGDQVLKSIAQTLRDSLRNFDMAARIGGEEFAILFPETSIKDATLALERIRSEVEALNISAGKKIIGVTISGGLAESNPKETIKVDDILNRADQLLYEAKNLGRNKICS